MSDPAEPIEAQWVQMTRIYHPSFSHSAGSRPRSYRPSAEFGDHLTESLHVQLRDTDVGDAVVLGVVTQRVGHVFRRSRQRRRRFENLLVGEALPEARRPKDFRDAAAVVGEGSDGEVQLQIIEALARLLSNEVDQLRKRVSVGAVRAATTQRDNVGRFGSKA